MTEPNNVYSRKHCERDRNKITSKPGYMCLKSEVVAPAEFVRGGNEEAKEEEKERKAAENRGEREEDERAANGGETSLQSPPILSGFI